MSDAELSAEGAREWARHAENILRGIGHALNNRAAALSAVAELSTGSAEDAGAAREIAAGEVHRLRGLARAIRALGEAGEPVEAFVPEDAAEDARALLELHREFRDAAPRIDASGAPPVRTHRATYVRALLALAGGTRGWPAAATPVTLTVRQAGDWVVAATPAPARARLTPLAQDLAVALDGEALSDGSYGFRVPTLEALRRREGR